MKKIASLLLALLLMLSLSAYAEKLPVLTAALGKSAELVSQQENGNEYVEMLHTEDFIIYMARLAGSLSAEEAAQHFCGEVYEGELIAAGEDGIDERALFLTGSGRDTAAADASVIQLEGYTYAFVCLCNAKKYSDPQTGADLREQVDFWAGSLDIFEDTAEPAKGGARWTYDMLLDFNEVWQSTAADGAEIYGLSAADGGVQWEEYSFIGQIVRANTETSLKTVAEKIDGTVSGFEWEPAADAGENVYDCAWQTERGGETMTCAAKIALLQNDIHALRVMLSPGLPEDVKADACQMLDGAALSKAADSAAAELAAEIGMDIFPDAEDLWFSGEAEINGVQLDCYEFVNAAAEPAGVLAISAQGGLAMAKAPEDTAFRSVKWNGASGKWEMEPAAAE